MHIFDLKIEALLFLSAMSRARASRDLNKLFYMYYVRFSLTYLPTKKLDILFDVHLESFTEPPRSHVTNSSRPLTDLKGKGNPDLPSSVQTIGLLSWLSVCVLTIWYF